PRKSVRGENALRGLRRRRQGSGKPRSTPRQGSPRNVPRHGHLTHISTPLRRAQRAACIGVARTVADVQAAVAYAREAGLTLAPQGTGHLGQALPSLEGTLLLKTALHDGKV